MDINKIIKGCKQHDRKCREELYKYTADSIMNVCIRYTIDKSTAKDVFQETYLKAFKQIKQFKSDKGSIKSWMSRIAVNTALSNIRKLEKLQFVESFHTVLEPITDEDPLADLTAKELLKLVNSLPNGYRIIFNMYVVEGYNHEEIGNTLGITASTSRSQLSRAKLALKDLINNNENQIGYEQAK